MKFSRVIKSRTGIAVVTFMVTAGMIGGATYATTSSTTDVYYACASLTGNIRASSIRLNSAPTRCSSTTDHVVQWDAAGQPIQPKAGRVIELANGMTITKPPTGGVTHVWPAVDTSECSSLRAFVAYSADGASRFDISAQIMLPGDTGTYGSLRSERDSGYYTEAGTTEGEVSSYLVTVAYAGGSTNNMFSIPPPATALRISINNQFYSSEPEVNMTITKAALYCTPY